MRATTRDTPRHLRRFVADQAHHHSLPVPRQRGSRHLPAPDRAQKRGQAAPDNSFFSFRWPGNYPVTAASWRGETACGGAADGECGRQQRAESLHSYRPMSTRAAATSRAAWSRVVARTSRAERSAAQGSAERGATSLVGAAEVADGALSVGNQRQPLRSGCIYGKLSAVRGHQGHQLQHHDVKGERGLPRRRSHRDGRRHRERERHAGDARTDCTGFQPKTAC